MKSGWWNVKFEITLEGKPVRFWELSETTQDHILQCINGDMYSGEILEDDGEDET